MWNRDYYASFTIRINVILPSISPVRENIVICIASTFQREPTRLLIEALEPTVYHRISFSEFSDLLKTSLAINRLYQKILEWL